jgi:hypothetical protein
MTKFRDICQGQLFDFILPDRYNSFFLTCTKISPRKYRDEKGTIHRVGSINCEVNPREVKFWEKYKKS